MYSAILGSALFSLVRLALAQDPIVLSSFWVGQISGEQECGGGVPNDCNEGGTWAMSDLSNFCSTVGVGSPFPAANGAQTNWCNVTVCILPFTLTNPIHHWLDMLILLVYLTGRQFFQRAKWRPSRYVKRRYWSHPTNVWSKRRFHGRLRWYLCIAIRYYDRTRLHWSDWYLLFRHHVNQ
jgi:hypothetical protein